MILILKKASKLVKVQTKSISDQQNTFKLLNLQKQKVYCFDHYHLFFAYIQFNEAVMEIQFISEDEVKSLLDWGEFFDAIKQAFLAVVPYDDAPKSSISPRSFTRATKGDLLTMPGFIENYPLPGTGNQKHSTLACKLVTSFPENYKLAAPLPSILATILLFDSGTGKLKSIIEGTEITTWRTAATSLVATKYVFFDRLKSSDQKVVLSIVGCGTQGSIHAKAMLSYFVGRFSEVRLWNRTTSKAEILKEELKGLFPTIDIKVADSVKDGVNNADIIVTTTYTSSPLINLEDIKADCYINGKLLNLNLKQIC